MLVRLSLIFGVIWLAIKVSLRRLVQGRKHPDWSWRTEVVGEAARFVVARVGLAPRMRRMRRSSASTAPASTVPHRSVGRGQRAFEKLELAGLRTEVHTPAGWTEAQPVLLYLHGGGYVTCSPATHRDLVARIARASGARCFVPNYRKAPRCPYPAAIDDAVACYRALLAEGIHPAQIFVGGDSAGGGLTLATLLRLREAGEPLPCAAILISPWVDLEAGCATIDSHAPFDYLSRALLEQAALHYVGAHDRRDPLISAIHADLSGLPPLLVQTGGAELFCEENGIFVERARAAGVTVTHQVEAGMFHVYQILAPMLPQALRAIASIGGFVRERAPVERSAPADEQAAGATAA